MSAPHRKVVNFTLKMGTFVTCLIWEGRRFHWPDHLLKMAKMAI